MLAGFTKSSSLTIWFNGKFCLFAKWKNYYLSNRLSWNSRTGLKFFGSSEPQIIVDQKSENHVYK